MFNPLSHIELIFSLPDLIHPSRALLCLITPNYSISLVATPNAIEFMGFDSY